MGDNKLRIKHIRVFTDEKQKEILKLLKRVYKEQEESQILDNLNIALNECKFSLMYLCDDEEEILGVCLFKEDVRLHTGRIVYIDTLVVKELNKGYGSRMLRTFQDSKIQLECAVDNKTGNDFYESRQFFRRAYSYIR